MKEVQYSVAIQAPKDKVWETLWQDATLRQWAGIIDPGTYMVGDLVAGREVQFISEQNGYGVTSLVDTVVPGEYLLLKHKADTQDGGTATRDDQWTGGQEKYILEEVEGNTTLTVTFDVPTELEAEFNVSYPKALVMVKTLAEA